MWDCSPAKSLLKGVMKTDPWVMEVNSSISWAYLVKTIEVGISLSLRHKRASSPQFSSCPFPLLTGKYKEKISIICLFYLQGKQTYLESVARIFSAVFKLTILITAGPFFPFLTFCSLQFVRSPSIFQILPHLPLSPDFVTNARNWFTVGHAKNLQ